MTKNERGLSNYLIFNQSAFKKVGHWSIILIKIVGVASENKSQYVFLNLR